jgi:hypothetical protein
MMTCRLTHCSQVGKCRLEETGAIDLCPVLRQIVEDARRQTEAAWAHKFPVHEVVILEHYKGTRTTNHAGFTLALALKKLATLNLVRREATLKLQEYHRRNNMIPVEPKEEPRRRAPRRPDLDFHEMPTLIDDYCAYPPLSHVEDLEARDLKQKEEVTKKQKQYWAELNARTQLQKRQDDRERILMQLLDDMKDKE